MKNGESCIENEELNAGNAVWIGARKFNNEWYEISATSSIGPRLNYTKVLQTKSTPSSDCAFIRKDGAWLDGTLECALVSLCTLCQIKGQPTFTLKGHCYISEIDWNYYYKLDTNNRLKLYEGYKKTNIVFDDSSHKWIISSKPGYPQSFEAEISKNKFTPKYPIGRKEWFINDPICQV